MRTHGMFHLRARSALAALAGMVAVLAFAAAAEAAPRLLRDVTEPPPRAPLPNAIAPGPHPVPAELVEAAASMPAARAAMARMEEAGYVRSADADAARAQDGRVFVALAYGDPRNPAHAPLVLVACDASGSVPRTQVAGGVFVVDAASGRVSLATDVPEANQFVVQLDDLAATDPAGFRVSPSGARSMRDWLECTLIGCGASAAGCMRIGGMIGIGPQAQVGCALVGCGLLAFACTF